jgi:hypothetical protein
MALEPSAQAPCYTVFSQRPDARVDVAEWARHAERFLGVRLGLTEDKRYDADPPARDTAQVVIAPVREDDARTIASGVRTCSGRPTTTEDLRAARDASQAGAGLADLAKRCPQVWLVETDATGDDDRVALRIAAILAGIMLGPILAPGGVELFGPKTARERLGA